MELYIRLHDGQPFEHPIFGTNFRAVFPNVDTNNLPLEFARFQRVEKPEIGVYQVYEGVSYEWVEGIVTDVHKIRNMTPEEKSAKQNGVKEYWANEIKFTSWVFNEETCMFDPPIPRPDDGFIYSWNETSQQWVNNDGDQIGVTRV